MQRYFVNESNKNLDIFTLNEEDSYHIVKVMRYKVGEEIEIVYEKDVFVCEILELGKNVKCIIRKTNHQIENDIPNITIAQSLVKEQKMDYILQKSTELGVDKIIPISASRSVIKVNDKSDKKIDRWRKIVKEASEQSKRNKVPTITDIKKITELASCCYDYKILCSVNEVSMSLKKVLQNVSKSDTILFVIGPEGGLEENDVEQLENNGAKIVTLGKRILRTETVALNVLSIIMYELEN